MQEVRAGAVVTTDGVIRNPQATTRALESDTWDGRRGSYIPVGPLSIDPSLELHTEADLDIDPITYQVLRSRFWHKNLEHGDVIQRVSGSAPVVYSARLRHGDLHGGGRRRRRQPDDPVLLRARRPHRQVDAGAPQHRARHPRR